MGIFSYLVALTLAICWAIGLFQFNLGPIVHVLLAAAFIVILIKVIQTKRSA